MRPATSPYLITAPTESQRCYEMCVQVPGLRMRERERVRPWIRITADDQTEAVTLAAGMTVDREDR